MAAAVISFEKSQNVELGQVVAAIRGALRAVDREARVTAVAERPESRGLFYVEVTAPSVSLGEVVETVEAVEGVYDAEPMLTTKGAVRATLVAE